VGGPAAKKLAGVAALFESMRPLLERTAPACVAEVVAAVRYREYLLDESPAEAEERIENVEELIAGAEAYARRAEDPSVAGFLSEVALLTDVDLWDETEDTVNLMTIHSAKGLEFPVVLITGLEEGLLPHASALDEPAELEEERRLFYVALTRARERVHLFHATYRRVWNAMGGGVSRFVAEIPPDCLTVDESAVWDGAVPRVARPSRSAGGSAQGARSAVGLRVIHPQFGEGVVVGSEGVGERAKLTIQFRRAGVKKILAAFAELSHAD
jgi:DNA helicase-2/ATP-dependent DNA helicase PcrA